MSDRKPILCLDFDGVLHSYTSGWKGADVIPDPPVKGAIDFLRRAVERFTVAVYSSRSGQEGGCEAMYRYLLKHAVDELGDFQGSSLIALLEWPTEKPPAHVTLDDRAMTFIGLWPSLDQLAAFRPWNK